MSETRPMSGPLHVRESDDADRPVVLHPSDDDLFVRTGKQVIGDCRLGISIQLWLQELRGMVEHVRDWSTQRSARIRSCYYAPMGARIAFFFSPTGRQFDFELADELVQLNSELLTRFNIGMVEVHQIPSDELDRFITPETARSVYGDIPNPPDPVAA